MEAVLEFTGKNKERVEQVLREHQSLVVGRNPADANIVVQDEKISGTHCRITLKSDRLEIQDLRSKNGVYLNGIRIEQSEVFMGDEIKIGGTIIKLCEKAMGEKAIQLLTFPGPFQERMNYELKADFTGARVQSQLYLKEHPGEVLSAYRAREIALRKKANSKIRLSKNQIKQNYRFLSLFSGLIDLLLLIAVIILPFMILSNGSSLPEVNFLKNNRIATLIAVDIALVLMFMTLNLKVLNYTLGEKISGIEDLHRRQ